MPESELVNDKPNGVAHDGIPILIVRRENQIFAIAGTCSHLGAPLAEGTLIGDSIQCPWHGSRFALEGGRVLDGPAVHPQPCLEARIRNGQIEVRKSNGGSAQH
jgi:nitrite reductase/ring-hydroxylating ferredoxin subunit